MLLEQLKVQLKEPPEGTIVGEALDVEEVVETTRTLSSDVVIVSFRLLGGPGLKTPRRVRELKPLATVIVQSYWSSLEYCEACLKAGADLFFAISLDIEEMGESVSKLI